MDQELMVWLARIEAKLDLVLGAMIRGRVGGGAAPEEGEEGAAGSRSENTGGEGELAVAAEAIANLTVKQHAVLQMLMRHAGNREIAERMGTTNNTAKVHVRLIAAKFGVTNRARIASLARAVISKMPDDVYERMSGGISKNWDAEWPRSHSPEVQALLKPRGDEHGT